jgi:hypothetical protein
MFQASVAALESRVLSLTVSRNIDEELQVRGYKGNPFGKTFTLHSQIPRSTYIDLNVFVFWSLRPKPLPLLIRADNSDDHLEVRLEDVVPELTPYFLLRLDRWLQRQLGRMLTKITEKGNF